MTISCFRGFWGVCDGVDSECIYCQVEQQQLPLDDVVLRLCFYVVGGVVASSKFPNSNKTNNTTIGITVSTRMADKQTYYGVLLLTTT